jgi:2-polyprenyl-6-methoxyphenol hydroxylase-like FAD-dependent oxidoreductase
VAAALNLARRGRRVHVLEKAPLFRHCLEIVIATNEADLTELDDGRRKP